MRNVWKIYPTNPLSIGILAIRKVNGLEKRYVEERGGKGGGQSNGRDCAPLSRTVTSSAPTLALEAFHYSI